MEQCGSEAPCFEKKMTHLMLQRNFRVAIPASFIRCHGHKLDSVISLMGPNGQAHAVAIKAYNRIHGRGQTELQFHLGLGWKEFVKENGFQTGECVQFKLLENSCFHVLGRKPSASKCDNERGLPLGKSGRAEAGRIIPQVKAPGLHDEKVTANVATKAPKPEFDCNSCETQVQRPWRGLDRDHGVTEEAAAIGHPQLRQPNYVKHPGLDAAISANSKFPRFVSKLSRSNLCGHDVRLELPYRFVAEYGHHFQARVDLLGPNCQVSSVGIRILPCRSSLRVQFRTGWRAFSLENGFREGDALLFSLVEFSKFRVQVFPAATHESAQFQH